MVRGPWCVGCCCNEATLQRRRIIVHRRSSFVVRRSSFVVRRLLVVRRSSFVRRPITENRLGDISL